MKKLIVMLLVVLIVACGMGRKWKPPKRRNYLMPYEWQGLSMRQKQVEWQKCLKAGAIPYYVGLRPHWKDDVLILR
jgi:hypothetical protein